jgi:hypothetical protein
MVNLVRTANLVGIDFTRHVFASEEYLSAQSSKYGWLVSDGFVLPFYLENILIFRRLIFTSAPICRSDQPPKLSAMQDFLDSAVSALDRNRLCDFISKPQSNAVFQVAPKRAVYCHWGTYETRIDRSDDVLLKSFHSKHRNVINKAKRDGVIVKSILDLRVVQQNIRETLLRQRLPFFPSLTFIQRLCARLPGQILTLGAFHNGQLQGVALVPFDAERGYYLYGGSIENPYGGSLNLLQFEVMRRLRDKGVLFYDFVGARINVEEGSKYEGIQRFKLRFGADLQKGFAFRVVFSPFKFALFSFLVKVYFALRGLSYVDPIDKLKINR